MNTANEHRRPHAPWWQCGVVYQVYPRSFQDTDGDGAGDLAGIRARLPHLAWLGIDAVWLSPIFPSPMADFGYDVADYTAVDPRFGTLDDLDDLVADLHARGMRLILDFVPNHSSDRHPWFQESRSSRNNPRRDWYLWRDARADGGPPNNWRSAFGGSAWEWDEATGQYYYHAFLKEQPDLNWRNRNVRAAMADVLRFWLGRGVDGFRVDVIWHLIKDLQWRDNPLNPAFLPGQVSAAELLETHSADQPEVHDMIAELRRVVDEFDDRVLIGEIYLPVERLVRYYGTRRQGVHLPFNFQLVLLPWVAEQISRAVERYESLLPAGGWPNWVLGNHDQPRVASRLGQGQARVAAMLLLTLRGTPTLYYGDEIGMENVAIPRDRERDPQGLREPGHSRDPQRTPMQWDGSANGGFSSGDPWLPLAADVADRNVASQHADRRSILWLHRELLALRRAEPALSMGSYRALGHEGDVMAYERTGAGRSFVVALNLGGEEADFPREARGVRGRIRISTRPERGHDRVDGALRLLAHEGVIVEVDGPTDTEG